MPLKQTQTCNFTLKLCCTYEMLNICTRMRSNQNVLDSFLFKCLLYLRTPLNFTGTCSEQKIPIISEDRGAHKTDKESKALVEII